MDAYAIGMLLAIGCLGGFAAGLLGIGAGVILVPLLSDLVLPYLKVPSDIIEQLARGTSMSVALFASISGAHRHHKNRCVIWKAVPFFALGSIFSAWLGTGLAVQLPRLVLRRILGGVMILAALRMLFGLHRPSEETEEFNPIHLVLLGLVTGLIAAVCGIGGGVIAVPVMVLLLHLPIKRVAGTSSAAIIATSAFGMLGYVYHGWRHPQLPSGTFGYVYWAVSLPLIASCVVCSQLGASVNFRTNPVPLRRVFGVLIGLLSLRMFVA